MKKNGKELIPEKERKERQKMVDYARASVDLERFPPSPEFEEMAERFVSGEMTIEELIAL